MIELNIEKNSRAFAVCRETNKNVAEAVKGMFEKNTAIPFIPTLSAVLSA
ncbi:MAG: hypothetical protein L6V93_10520 [Clostridiales bacterium]|nr:MAG: hypothetical protein L6V93_10520 [Clostridiales bacterium]